MENNVKPIVFTLCQGDFTTCPVLVSDPADASVSVEELPTCGENN